MKKAALVYPGGKKTLVEITGLNDIIQHVTVQPEGDLQTAFSSELHRTTHDYVLVMVGCATESEHDVACIFYVVPVGLESAKAGRISADKIRSTARREFGIDIGSLRPCGTQHACIDDDDVQQSKYIILY